MKDERNERGLTQEGIDQMVEAFLRGAERQGVSDAAMTALRLTALVTESLERGYTFEASDLQTAVSAAGWLFELAQVLQMEMVAWYFAEVARRYLQEIARSGSERDGRCGK